jgi:uncharacterized repeat protein (TIGR04138 family)
MAAERLRMAHLAFLRGSAKPLREGAEPLRESPESLREGVDAFSPAGLEYLLALIKRMAAQGKSDLRADELCQAFGRAAAQDFGPFLAEALDRFAIRTGAELGRAVFLLAAEGCLTLREGETLEEYAACGRLGDGT